MLRPVGSIYILWLVTHNVAELGVIILHKFMLSVIFFYVLILYFIILSFLLPRTVVLYVRLLHVKCKLSFYFVPLW